MIGVLAHRLCKLFRGERIIGFCVCVYVCVRLYRFVYTNTKSKIKYAIFISLLDFQLVLQGFKHIEKKMSMVFGIQQLSLAGENVNVNVETEQGVLAPSSFFFFFKKEKILCQRRLKDVIL